MWALVRGVGSLVGNGGQASTLCAAAGSGALERAGVGVGRRVHLFAHRVCANHPGNLHHLALPITTQDGGLHRTLQPA